MIRVRVTQHTGRLCATGIYLSRGAASTVQSVAPPIQRRPQLRATNAFLFDYALPLQDTTKFIERLLYFSFSEVNLLQSRYIRELLQA